MKNLKPDIYKIWNKRWENKNKKKLISFLGRRMFKAKEKSIKEVIAQIDVEKIIEVGCGLGYTMEVYQDLGKYVVGIDVSENSVKYCIDRGLNVFQSRLEDVNEKYDLVSSDGMLEHFLNFEPYAQKMMAISRKYVVLIQPNHDSFVGKTLVYFSELFRGSTNVFEYNYRIKDFIAVFKANGFSLKKSESIFFDVFRLLLFKREVE